MKNFLWVENLILWYLSFHDAHWSPIEKSKHPKAVFLRMKESQKEVRREGERKLGSKDEETNDKVPKLRREVSLGKSTSYDGTGEHVKIADEEKTEAFKF